MMDRLRFFVNRLRERLWLRPLAMCILSVALALLAKAADYADLPYFVPNITADTIETLLKTISASMLVIATFAVGSMVNSYASASNSATPRSFPLVIADDVSQNALSSFIGAFIFSIVSLVALLNGVYAQSGRFALFCLTLVAFAVVILTFVRWVDRIARLGRVETAIEKAETAATQALQARRRAPTLRGAPVRSRSEAAEPVGEPVFTSAIGYVQRIEISGLQKHAAHSGMRIEVAALPGTYIMPGRPLAFLMDASRPTSPIDREGIAACFQIADSRTFDDDPRFSLIILSEIASRALSPGVNDPGTAIDIINVFVRLFALWSQPVEDGDKVRCEYDRVEVPEIAIEDMFEDAFGALARDGADTLEVGIRLQKALQGLAKIGDEDMKRAAAYHARLAFARAEQELQLPEDVDAVRAAGLLCGSLGEPSR